MAEPKLPQPAAYIWHEHYGEKTKSLRWSAPSQWEYATKVEPLYTEEQVRELLEPSTPLQHPSTRPSSVEGGELALRLADLANTSTDLKGDLWKVIYELRASGDAQAGELPDLPSSIEYLVRHFPEDRAAILEWGRACQGAHSVKEDGRG